MWASRLAILSIMIFLTLIGQGFTDEGQIIAQFPIDGSESIVDKSLAGFDDQISSDGKGSIKVETDKPVVVRLFTVGGLDVDDARLIYRAKVKTKDFKGVAYLEMWLTFKDKSTYFSRGLDNSISDDKDWETLQTPFFLKKGQNPESALLSIAVIGEGNAWIDNIELLKAPLE